MLRTLTPPSIRPPFGRYSHGVLAPPGSTVLVTSGQLGIRPDDTVPDDVREQAEICFRSIGTILEEAGMSFADVIRINAFVTRREDFPAYMAVRDRFVGAWLPASTLVIVSGFTRPEFKVEVEATAARAP
ncbi:MAG TPA: RidA family protein [Methylomirabilota bacterium]|nr:RidA family protein [Methylomirabilota bacterium]